jgi:hypothetical protein
MQQAAKPKWGPRRRLRERAAASHCAGFGFRAKKLPQTKQIAAATLGLIGSAFQAPGPQALYTKRKTQDAQQA